MGARTTSLAIVIAMSSIAAIATGEAEIGIGSAAIGVLVAAIAGHEPTRGAGR